MSLPAGRLVTGIAAAATMAFLCGFTLREQLTDLKPAVFYAALMYVLSVFSLLIMATDTLSGSLPLPALAAMVLLPRPEFLRITLRLALIVQLSALLFRSTSSSEIREGLIGIERFIRLKVSRLPFLKKRISAQCRFAENISLFLCFIPEIFETWNSINLAWKARGGKQGLRKIRVLVFALISLSFEKAALKSRALAAREGTQKKFTTNHTNATNIIEKK
jgi:biotin transport system permease protein/energy-coupling factor transport system permease protein